MVDVTLKDNSGTLIPECGAVDKLMPRSACQIRGPHTDGLHHHYFADGGGYSWQMASSSLTVIQDDSKVARGHVVQGIGGHTPRTITELSAEELVEVFNIDPPWNYVHTSDNGTEIVLDGRWNVGDLLTALAAKLAEEG